MAEADINVDRFIENTVGKTTVYTPIIEAIVNAIDAIDEAGVVDGKVIVKLKRANVLKLDDEGNDSIPPIESIEISDNGIGFTDKQRASFKTLYSAKKALSGGKGFGRFTYLKYFNNVHINSTYSEKNILKKREFDFNRESLITNEMITVHKDPFPTGSHVVLSSINSKHRDKFNKRLDTIARKLFEDLMVFFIQDDYKPPTIVLEDAHEGDVVLNDYLNTGEDVQLFGEMEFKLENHQQENQFKIKVFKIYFTQAKSSILLTAHNRVVTKSFMHTYVPEFIDDFYDEYTNQEGEISKKNYSIKAYTMGPYLDLNVTYQRNSFNFADSDEEPMFPHSKKAIEKNVSMLVNDRFIDEVNLRRNKKVNAVRKYVEETAPWHKQLVDELNFDELPYNLGDKEIDAELHKVAFEREVEVKKEADKISAGATDGDLAEKIQTLVDKLTAPMQAQLTHYVVLRKVVIDMFDRALKLNDQDRHELEETVHNIIYPIKSDSNETLYDSHNLWLIDEKLSYNAYLASDKPLTTGDKRPDILIYDNPVALRSGDDASNPISVFELKRPGRKNYPEDEDPIKQVLEYVNRIRSGGFTTPENRPVNVTDSTPAYGYVICDLTKKIRELCDFHQLTLSPDNEGYFGYHNKYQVYIQVISFDKLLKDTRLRNRILFSKLGIE